MKRMNDGADAGPAPMTAAAGGKLTITCQGFRPLERNTLRGFVSITIAELRLTIHDIAVHEKGESRWAQLPAKPQVRDGELVTDDAGKIQYWPIMEFASRAVRDAFSAAVIRALLEFAPAAFDKEDAS
jgi:hypothetical protein